MSSQHDAGPSQQREGQAVGGAQKTASSGTTKASVDSKGSSTSSSSSNNASASSSSSSAAPPRAHSPTGSATSASSRLWSAWISPSTSASNAASSRFEERRRRRRPSFEEFRAQEPPQARLIRLRGLFDVLLDKDNDEALAGGRAKQDWMRSATRARYGAGGIYARGSMAPRRENTTAGETSGSSNSSSGGGSGGDAAFDVGPSSSSSSSFTTSSPTVSSSARNSSPTTTSSVSSPSPPRQSYAKELLSQCRECRAQLEKERQSLERSQEKVNGEGQSWTGWIPFMGNGDAKESADKQQDDLSASVVDKLTGFVGLGSHGDTKEDSKGSSDTSSISSITSSISSWFGDSNKNASSESTDGSSSSPASNELHSDHEGEAGWIGSGVWGLSAVGAKQRQADRDLDKRLADGEAIEEDAGRRQRQIEWEGFLRYADLKERELFKIFTELDKNADMRLDVTEISTALDRANIEISQAGLEDFIASLGSSSRFSGNGCPSSITFPQFRDYLLLLPRKPSVNEIFRFYQVRKAFGLFGSQGIFAEFSDRLGRGERHGATSVTQDGDVSLAGEERKRIGDEEREAKREARRIAAAAEGSDESSEANRRSSEQSGTAHTEKKDAQNHGQTTGQQTQSTGKEDDHQQTSAGQHEGDEEEEEDSDIIHGDVAVKFLLAGGIAGAVSRTATAPFDRLKVYLITSASGSATGEALKLSSPSATKLASKGMGMLREAVFTLYREGGGLKAFWVGNGLNCLKIFPESAIKFLSYETAKRAFAKYVDGVHDSRDISGSSRFMSGGFGGITSQFAIYPVETLKTRLMSSQGGKLQGNGLLFETARNMWKQGGLRTYYRGLTAGLIGVFPYSAIDMSTFEGIKLFYIKYTGKEEPGVLALLAFGSISGSVGATTVYPLSLVRTRLQAAGTPAHPRNYDGFWDACRVTYRQEGVVGFYRGLVPSLAKVVPAVSISYVVYEHSKRHLGVQ